MCCSFMLEYLGKKILWSATVVQHNVCYACFGFKGHLGSQLLLCYSCAAAIPGHETLCLAPKMSKLPSVIYGAILRLPEVLGRKWHAGHHAGQYGQACLVLEVHGVANPPADVQDTILASTRT